MRKRARVTQAHIHQKCKEKRGKKIEGDVGRENERGKGREEAHDGARQHEKGCLRLACGVVQVIKGRGRLSEVGSGGWQAWAYK